MAGFTKTDNQLLEMVLTSDFTKRQLKILLLIIRFSFGYQKTYAILRRNDFSYAGVSPYCIKDELKKLVKRRVITWNPQNDTVWINTDFSQWAVDKSVDRTGENLRRFFKIATKNSMKQQLAIYRISNPELAETATLYKERNKKRKSSKENTRLELLRDYFLNVSPLTEPEMFVMSQVIESYPPRTIREAISTVSSKGERSFSSFLKVLDGLASQARQGKMGSLKSSLRRFRKLTPGT